MGLLLTVRCSEFNPRAPSPKKLDKLELWRNVLSGLQREPDRIVFRLAHVHSGDGLQSAAIKLNDAMVSQQDNGEMGVIHAQGAVARRNSASMAHLVCFDQLQLVERPAPSRVLSDLILQARQTLTFDAKALTVL